MSPWSPLLKLSKLLFIESSRIALQKWINVLQSGEQRPLGPVVPYPFTED